jgi:hypothetical protein
MIVVSSKSSVHQGLLRPNDQHAMFRFLRDIYCHKIGYAKTPRMRAAPIPPRPPAMLPIENGAAGPSEWSAPAPAVSVPPSRPQGTCVNAVPIAFAHPSFGSAPAGTAGVAPRGPTGYSPSDSQTMQVNQRTSSSLAPGTDLVGKRKRGNDDAALTVSSKKQATDDLVGSSSAGDQVSAKNHAARPCYPASALCHPNQTMQYPLYGKLMPLDGHRYASIWEIES